ncbi:MAG TPA: hypothetical protein VK504_24825 [Vicinamibacterales bacterium]|nr:hypothetical protein [Vicinamibacterales bacterium]
MPGAGLAGKLPADRSISSFAEQASRFAAENEIAAKSIGVEYLESADRLVITLGYRTAGESYPITLKSVSLGNAGSWEEGRDFTDLEARMRDAAARIDNIICHELFVTTDGELVMVFMTLA